MSKIRILPEEVSNRIAAGEVVERPASVVKELVENSLDAGASHISIYVQRGGRTSIRVVDDGGGMDREDSLLCLEAHATSKIKHATDIEKITSLGFRGEALPSIASISRMVMQTRTADVDIGSEVVVDGGVIKRVEDTGCAPGTSITVKSIFYNLPARRKFLRSIKTEEFHVQETVFLLAIANPSVGFDLMLDSRSVISVQPSNDLLTRATMLLGKDMMSSMLPVDYSDNGNRIRGFVARPGVSRTSRRDQRIFVNGRPVADQTIYYAIRDAYHTLVMKGRYPPTLLFLTVDPETVDVNVHPAKREVRFRNQREVGEFVGRGIRMAMREIVADVPFSPGPEARILTGYRPEPGTTGEPPLPFRPRPVAGERPDAAAVDAQAIDRLHNHKNREYIEASMDVTCPTTETADQGRLNWGQNTVESGTSISAANRDEIRQLRVIGILSDLFLVAEGTTGLVLIDQHAAHERILYEKVLSDARKRDGIRQGLLIPITIDFSTADANTLQANLENLKKLGFDIENFGGSTYVITSIPAHFPQENIAGMLRDIIDDLQDNPLGMKRADDARLAKSACKAAVKAHDQLSDTEISCLLDDLISTELPYTCPHGRPTMINISFNELEKRFGRRT